MRDRARLPLMKSLAAVQRAQRASAEAQLFAAQAAEAAARSAEDEARATAAEAERHWLDHLAAPGFSPEYGRALSERLIGRHDEANIAAEHLRTATGLRSRREADWQKGEARVRLSEASVRRLKRRIDRRAEENRMSELADRVTYSWSRS
ncbi:MAG TPA: hypothetical protein VGB70_03805 [Allosphingosinicella sp.]|jgi:hypothetical protein